MHGSTSARRRLISPEPTIRALAFGRTDLQAMPHVTHGHDDGHCPEIGGQRWWWCCCLKTLRTGCQANLKLQAIPCNMFRWWTFSMCQKFATFVIIVHCSSVAAALGLVMRRPKVADHESTNSARWCLIIYPPSGAGASFMVAMKYGWYRLLHTFHRGFICKLLMIPWWGIAGERLTSLWWCNWYFDYSRGHETFAPDNGAAEEGWQRLNAIKVVNWSDRQDHPVAGNNHSAKVVSIKWRYANFMSITRWQWRPRWVVADKCRNISIFQFLRGH